MAMKVVYTIAVLLPAIAFGLLRDADCETPNNEEGRCIASASCYVIKSAVATQNRDAIKFAQESQCGYDTEPLICCGSTAFKTGRGDYCMTPNEEITTCKPVTACKVIIDAVQTKNTNAIKFAQASQCGYDTEPLICCGSTGYHSKNLSQINELLPARTVCGLPKATDKIVGGELTAIDEFPWMALLGYKNNKDGSDAGFKCGGSLINKRYVLTAAHCVLTSYQGFEVKYVRLGEWQIKEENDCNEQLINDECADPVVDINIEQVIPHSQYNRRTGRNDIALLRLEKNLPRFTDYIKPICLPQPNTRPPPEGSKVTVAGWGATGNETSSDYKLKVEIPMVSNNACSEKITQRNVTDDQVCAGGVFEKDSCKGDSGGPLMGTLSKTISAGGKIQWYQEGIVSWGLQCGVAGYPGIYTRVSKYVKWIVDNMKEF